ncbi:LysR family transcriptional regulator [Paraburkholderia sp. J63]|uniref:LysR family transcriptional regulator n=1 Tax=Paraburkholderia sp. J63 TaxID=2805434 RepID=UPI002ABE1486|nr:LysR family transcriptional regulator [Paraburkholderia sp. J63]
MRFNRLDLNLLVALDAVLDERSVCKAAERVFLSQSAMSCALARLRDYFGDELLVQVGKTLTLTPLGSMLKAPVRELLLRAQAITLIKPDFDPAVTGRKITLIAADNIVSVLLIDVMREVRAQAPGMEIDVRPVTNRFAEEFNQGDVDLMIVVDGYASPQLPSEPLFDDTFSCLCWQHGKWAGAPLSLDDYMSAQHVVFDFGMPRMPALDELTTVQLGYRRRRAVTVSTPVQIPQFVVGSDYVGTVFTRLAHRMAETWPLVLTPCPVELPVVRWVVQWHDSRGGDAALIWFKDVLRRVALAKSADPADSHESPRARPGWPLPHAA